LELPGWTGHFPLATLLKRQNMYIISLKIVVNKCLLYKS